VYLKYFLLNRFQFFSRNFFIFFLFLLSSLDPGRSGGGRRSRREPDESGL